MSTPLHLYKGRGRRSDAVSEVQRKGLLAKIHVAKKQLGLGDEEYKTILKGFKADSAAELSIAQMENMVRLLKRYGFRPRKTRRERDPDTVLPVLRERCVDEAGHIPNGQKRLAGLAKKFCGTAQLTWCRDEDKLKRILYVLRQIREKEGHS